jgi:hypothetical protein
MYKKHSGCWDLRTTVALGGAVNIGWMEELFMGKRLRCGIHKNDCFSCAPVTNFRLAWRFFPLFRLGKKK